MEKPIQVTKSSLPDFEEYINEIKDLWDSRWLTNNGLKHQELEKMLKRFLTVSNLTLFTNGHLALEHAIEALDLTGEVITTPFTFASTTHAIVRKGLTPIFCDINLEDYTIDVSLIEELITEKTSAIIPVHVYGNVSNISAIEKIAKKYNLKVIYDAAHTFGVRVNGRGIGEFGDISMFSFHATKVFHTIEGGALSFQNSSLGDKLNDLKNFGIAKADSIKYIGSNAKMNEFQAAMGLCNLRVIDKDISKRKVAVDRYRLHLENIPGIQLAPLQEGIESNFAYFPIVFNGFKKDREKVFNDLQNENITARRYFYPLTNKLECYSEKFNSGNTPNAEFIAERVLCLPLYADLALEDIDRICKIIMN